MTIKKSSFFTITLLFFTFTALYFAISYSLLEFVLGPNTELYRIAYVTLNLVIIFSLLLGAFLIRSDNTVYVTYRCLIMILVLTPLLFFPNAALRLLIIFIQGIIIGLGQLVSLTFFWNLTRSEERGRVAGFAGFFVVPLFQVIGGASQIVGFNWTIIIIIVLSLGALSTKLFGLMKGSSLSKMNSDKGFRHEKRTIILYAIPWIIFSLVNFTLARNISSNIFDVVPSSLYTFLSFLQIISSALGASIGGIISDLDGRRSALGVSLTLFGISIVFGGIFQAVGVFYLMYIINGFTWGILWTLYITVVWGDLGDEETVVKNYSLGLLIFYLAVIFGFVFIPQISQIPVVTSSFLGCLLVLLSNIPLVVAPELLSSEFQEKLKLMLHFKSLKKIRKSSKNHG